jgi:hypothetical protein
VRRTCPFARRARLGFTIVRVEPPIVGCAARGGVLRRLTYGASRRSMLICWQGPSWLCTQSVLREAPASAVWHAPLTSTLLAALGRGEGSWLAGDLRHPRGLPRDYSHGAAAATGEEASAAQEDRRFATR